MIESYSTAVFDLDGTLSDPSEGIARCFNHALRVHGIPEIDEAEIARQIGPPLDETFALFAAGKTEASIDTLIATYRERYATLGYAENRIYEGIPTMLQQLHDSGRVMGVCTSKRADFAQKILELFGIEHYFSFVSGGDTGVKKRDQLDRLLSHGKIDSNAVMIGDRQVDIESARANGLRAVGVEWGFAEPGELLAAEPVAIVSEVRQLATCLGA
jgi:phosphoglycolate phosphatase